MKELCRLDLYDPWANREEIKKFMNYPKKINYLTYDGVIIAVSHDQFKQLGANKITHLCKKKHIIYDLKYLYKKDQVDLRL